MGGRVWRSDYFTALDDSLRTSFLIRWPNKIPAGGVSDEIVHINDLMPTLDSVADYAVPTDRIVYGLNQMDFLDQSDSRKGI